MGRFWLLKPVPQAALTLRPFLLMRSRRMELLLQSAPALRLWATQIAGTQLRLTDALFTTPMRHPRTLQDLRSAPTVPCQLCQARLSEAILPERQIWTSRSAQIANFFTR